MQDMIINHVLWTAYSANTRNTLAAFETANTSVKTTFRVKFYCV